VRSGEGSSRTLCAEPVLDEAGQGPHAPNDDPLAIAERPRNRGDNPGSCRSRFTAHPASGSFGSQACPDAYPHFTATNDSAFASSTAATIFEMRVSIIGHPMAECQRKITGHERSLHGQPAVLQQRPWSWGSGLECGFFAGPYDNRCMLSRRVILLLFWCPLVFAGPPMTKIRVQVQTLGGQPVDRASVVVQFVEGHSIVKFGKKIVTRWELRTNQEGIARIPAIPQGKIRVQVIAKGFQTSGDVYDVNEEEKTIVVKMNPPQPQYSAH
jgi:hypothetical protein